MICVSNGKLRSHGPFSVTTPAFITSFRSYEPARAAHLVRLRLQQIIESRLHA